MTSAPFWLWCARLNSNQRPTCYEQAALTAEHTRANSSGVTSGLANEAR